VTRKGLRADKHGSLWQRYQCRSVGDEVHRFRVLVEVETPVVTLTAAPTLCREHPDEYVVRNGSYGKVTKRQKYRCTRNSLSPHYFTQVLPREYIAGREVMCSGCEEFLNVHKGSQAASRHAKWPIPAVVDALIQLAQGVSYSRAPLNVWEKAKRAEEHALSHNPAWSGDLDPFGVSTSWRAEKGRNAWHVAGDLVEQYSPLLFGYVEGQVKQREARQRVNAGPKQPHVIVS